MLTACILTNMRSVGALYIINIHTELAPVCEDCIKKTNTLRERSIPDNRKRLPSLRVFFDGTRESYGYYQEYLSILLEEKVYTIRRNLRSEVLNVRSEVLNVRSKALNIRSTTLNGDFS